MKSLPELLREKSPQHHTRYAYIKEIAGSGFQKHATLVGYLTDHGPQHYENLEIYLSHLLPDEVKQQLAVEEIFLLLCAVHFHDIGLLSEEYPDEPWTDVRKDHVNRTYDYLHDYYQDWGLNQFEAASLKNICLGHSGDTFDELPEEAVIHHARIRVRFLTALLRIADELDLDYTRVSPIIPHLKKISENSLEHWKKHAQIGGVLINPKSWTIEVHAMPKNEVGKAIIESLVEQKLQRELQYVRPVFEKYGLYYRQVIVKHEVFGKKRSSSDQSKQSKRDSRSSDEASQENQETPTPAANTTTTSTTLATGNTGANFGSQIEHEPPVAQPPTAPAPFAHSLIQAIVYSGVPEGILSGDDKPQAIRANELVRWAESQGDPGLLKLYEAIQRAKYGKKRPNRVGW